MLIKRPLLPLQLLQPLLLLLQLLQQLRSGYPD
jgi:hypothetical protein